MRRRRRQACDGEATVRWSLASRVRAPSIRRSLSMSAPTEPTAAPLVVDPPVRQDWLDRWREEILEPDLPIVDPHHHLWDTLSPRALSARRVAGRPEQRPQHRRDRLPAMPVDASRRRAGGAPPGRRDRVRQRHRRHERQRRLRPDPRLRRHRRPRRPAARRPGAGGAGGAPARRRRALPRHPAHLRLGRLGAPRPPTSLSPACWPTPASAPASRGWRRSACRSTPGSTTPRSTS